MGLHSSEFMPMAVIQKIRRRGDDGELQARPLEVLDEFNPLGLRAQWVVQHQEDGAALLGELGDLLDIGLDATRDGIGKVVSGIGYHDFPGLDQLRGHATDEGGLARSRRPRHEEGGQTARSAQERRDQSFPDGLREGRGLVALDKFQLLIRAVDDVVPLRRFKQELFALDHACFGKVDSIHYGERWEFGVFFFCEQGHAHVGSIECLRRWFG